MTMMDRNDSPAVHVIDDDESFRTGMIRLLGSAGFRAVSYECAGRFLLSHTSATCGCILLDIAMPGPSGIDLLQALVDRSPAPPVIFVTGRDDVCTSVDVMRSGAFDYLVKPVGAERVVQVVRRALQLDAERRLEQRELERLRRRFESLTLAERAIFDGIVHHRLNKQMATDLGVCERTIKVQRARMMRKLRFSTVPELVRAAWQLEGGGNVADVSSDEVPTRGPCAVSEGRAPAAPS
jgi:FixJ family two-component response regulator